MLARLKPVTITAISLSDRVGIWITKNLVRTYDRNHHACSTPPVWTGKMRSVPYMLYLLLISTNWSASAFFQHITPSDGPLFVLRDIKLWFIF